MSWKSTMKPTLFALSLLSATGVAGTAFAEKTLKAGAFAPLETTWAKPFGMFVDHVNEIGAGVLQIQAMGPDAMPATEQPNALRSGLLDMIVAPPGGYKNIVPEANAQDLSNMTLEEQKTSGGYDAIKEMTREKLGAEILTSYGPGVNFHLYLRDEVATVEELEGMRVRSQPLFQPFFSSLGLTTSTIAIPEVYTALERGVVKGYAFPAWGVQDLGWLEQTAVRAEPGFYNVVVNILMNEDSYNSLSGEERAVLDEAISWFDDMLPAYMAEEGAMHRKAQDDAGVKAVDFGPGFAKQAEDAYWDVLTETSPELIGKLRPLLQK